MRTVFLTILLIASACGKKHEQKKSVVFALKEMGELATVEYTVTKIIKASDNKTWFKLGDRKILMSCEAHIKAGIDLSLIRQEDFVVDGKNVQLMLPQPQVISLSIPPENIRIEYQQVNAFRDPFTGSERDALAVQAETQIRNSVESLGILKQAKANTSLFLNTYLKRLGYDNINISYVPENQLKQVQ